MTKLTAVQIAEYLDIVLNEERELADEFQDKDESYWDSGMAELDAEARRGF
jgi:hypothetical protein